MTRDQEARLFSRIAVLEIVVHDLAARSFGSEAEMLNWTDRAAEQARIITEAKPEASASMPYSRAWDDLCAGVRMQYAFLRDQGLL